MNLNNKDPCIVSTLQGDSILYKDKYLYSKYNPSKSILETINSLQILPGTLFLCCSPVLNYGINELIQKLPENCFLLGIELEEDLLQFENKYLDLKSLQNFSLLTKQEAFNLPQILQEKQYLLSSNTILPQAGTFRRIVKIDFSAGVNFNTNQYNEIYNYSVNSIMTFWKNRMTITKFGRKYSLDLFTNLKILQETTPITSYFKNIKKPIVLFGSGESSEKGIKEIQNNRNDYFILCADTILHSLIKSNIIPDGVFIEEAQNIILKSFIGCLQNNIQIFAGLSSVPQLSALYNKKNISFFLTLYSNEKFISNLVNEEFICASNKPFGSVGLTMVYYALQFRNSDEIPIFIYGLDFSYSISKTHANGTMAHKNSLLNNSRIKPIENYNSSFSNNAKKTKDINNKTIITTPILESYAQLFNNFFTNEKNIFNSSDSGLPLKLQNKKPYSLKNEESNCKEIIKNTYTQKQIENLNKYLQNEKETLIQIKNILIGNTKIQNDKLDATLCSLLENREYLYTHFADGYKFTINQSYLNRIRTEIDCFLKILN